MKVFARAFWDPNSTCNPNFPSSTPSPVVDLKSFIRPDGGPTRDETKVNSPQEMTWQEGQGGGTRWNPTQEQIGILEKLYTGGMRTPNAEQIEHVTAQLSKYGKIEGKNVFYWFQNHKARERQKQKRVSSTSLLSLNFHTPAISKSKEDLGREDQASTTKRKWRSAWTSLSNEDGEEEVGHKKTLKLFPLHPEGGVSTI